MPGIASIMAALAAEGAALGVADSRTGMGSTAACPHSCYQLELADI